MDLTKLEMFEGGCKIDGPDDKIDIKDPLYTKKDQAGVEYFGMVLYVEPSGNYGDSAWWDAHNVRESLLKRRPELKDYAWISRSDAKLVDFILKNPQLAKDCGLYVKWFPLAYRNHMYGGNNAYYEEVMYKSIFS